MPSIRRPRTTAALAALATAGVLATQVLAAPPTVTGLTISPNNSPVVGESRTFTATASDPDNDIASYEWDFDYGGTVQSFNVDLTTAENSTPRSYDSPGERLVAVRAVDAAGDPATGGDGSIDTSGLAVRQINVRPPNQPPNAVIGCSPAQVNEGQPVSCTSSGSSDDAGIVKYEWQIDSGGFTEGGSTFNPTLTPGDHTVTLRVSDTAGEGDTATSGNISVNALPIARLAILNGSAEPGQKITQPRALQPFVLTAAGAPATNPRPPAVLGATGSATACPPIAGSAATPGSSDPGGSIDQYEWDRDGDGTFELTTDTPETVVVNGFPAGDRVARVRVTDSSGATATAVLNYRVNSAPVAQFVLEPLTPLINQETIFSSSSFDLDSADSGALRFSWDLDDDGVFCESGETGLSVRRSFPTANTSPGHRVRLWVTDSGGLTREATRTVVVQNTVPRASISFSPSAPIPGQATSFRASASSPTGKAIQSIQWDFDFDPSKDRFDVNATGAAVTRSFSSAGRKTIGLKVQEVGGGYAIVDRTVVVNSPPRAAFTVTPSALFAGDTAVVASTSGDSDGRLVVQDWDFDNDGQFDDASGSVINARFGRVGTFVVRLRVTDDKGATAVAASKVTVRKRPLKLLSGIFIQIRGSVDGRFTQVKRLLVQAPRGAKVAVKCMRKGCADHATKRGNGRKQRVKALEGRLRAGTKIVIAISKSGYLTQKTTFTTRRGKGPLRKDVCLEPGSRKGLSCRTGT